MRVIYSGTSVLNACKADKRCVLVPATFAYEGWVPWCDCWDCGGEGGLFLSSLTALANAFADSAMDDIGSVEEVRVLIIG